ncbi:MAG TPA: hypothetical protein VK826_20510 [Bacteroidia bacterium]|nr:hypothetical protein [Bacteroidia bacterium]
MKKSISIFILATSLFAVSCGSEETAETVNKTEAKTVTLPPDATQAFGQKVTELVIANDYAGLTSLIITKDEMTKAIQGSTAPANGKEFAISRVEDEIKEMQVDVKTGLDQIRASGTTAGIVWDKCTFKEARPSIDQSRGFDMMQLKCVIDCNGTEHIFTVTDVVGTDAGWKLGGKMIYGEVSTQSK